MVSVEIFRISTPTTVTERIVKRYRTIGSVTLLTHLRELCRTFLEILK